MAGKLIIQRYQPGQEPAPWITENARLQSALGRARGYIITHGPIHSNKQAVLEKIKLALKPEVSK